MRQAGALLPFSPLAACHVCLATSADDIDEMVAAVARVRPAHVTDPQEVTMIASSDRFPMMSPACREHGFGIPLTSATATASTSTSLRSRRRSATRRFGCSPAAARSQGRRCGAAGIRTGDRRRNEGDLEATVHWHGLRLGNRWVGTTDTQQPMPIGGSSTAHLISHPAIATVRTSAMTEAVDLFRQLRTRPWEDGAATSCVTPGERIPYPQPPGPCQLAAVPATGSSGTVRGDRRGAARPHGGAGQRSPG
jgi:hypothetical protein